MVKSDRAVKVRRRKAWFARVRVRPGEEQRRRLNMTAARVKVSLMAKFKVVDSKLKLTKKSRSVAKFHRAETLLLMY